MSFARISAFVRLAISAVLVVAAVLLFLYPAWTVVRVLTDDGMANGSVPRVVISRFGRVLDAAHTAALVITNPVTATWVKQKWGATYLTEKNLFYRNLIIMGLAAYEDVTGDVVPSKGGTPGIVWIMFGVYAVGGVVLLAAALRMAHRADEAFRQT